MCDSVKDGVFKAKPQCLKGDICSKCHQIDASVTHLQASLCKECFQVYVIHKFRAAIGRTKLITNGEEILVAFSGGANSAALLHLIEHGKSDRAHRKLRFIPSVLFIDEFAVTDLSHDERMVKRAEVLKLLTASGFPSYVTSIDKALTLNTSDSIEDSIFSQVMQLDSSSLPHDDALKVTLSKLSSLTSIEDLIKQLRCQLITTVARKLHISKVLTAENCTKLAVQVLSSVAQGRGSQISLSAGFSDTRNNDVMIIRPLRDLTCTDLEVYNKLSDVKSVFFPGITKMGSVSSIESLTESFVLNLQKDFPSTVSNIKRTSEKLEHPDLKLPKCELCQSSLDNQMGPSSAFSALRFSLRLSHQDLQNKTESSLQEHLSQVVCYGCYLTLKDFNDDHCTEPVFLRQIIKKL